MLETATLQSLRNDNLTSIFVGCDFLSTKNRIAASNLLPPEVVNRNIASGTSKISHDQKIGLDKLWYKSTTQFIPETRTSFKALESWVGQVMNVDEINGNFTALVISDLHSETREVAEFTFEEISEDDQSLVKPGAIFYWSVGYQINEFNGRSTASTLRFKRIRHWIRKEIESAQARAEKYSDWFVRGTNGTTDASSGA